MSEIGRPRSRVDGREKVTGKAVYAAEFNPPGCVHAVLIGATVGLGRVRRIDAGKALSAPGVLTVITHENAPRLAYRPHRAPIDPPAGERLHILQGEEVRFFGQPVAVVVAETLEQAEHAAALMRIDYLAARPATAWTDTSPAPPEGGRGRTAEATARGDADAALAAAPVKIDRVYEMARENHNPIEPHATVARWEGDHLTLWSKSQFVINEAAEIAAVFGLPAGHVTVVCPYVGGAFGTTLRTWPHVTAAALAARVVRRPVKLVLQRRQMFHVTGSRPKTRQRVALGADAAGRLRAIIHEGIGETSRYETFIEALTSVTPMLYSCDDVRTRYQVAPLDISTPNHMRGPGEASGIFALESAMDELAHELDVDPVELRLQNEPQFDEGARLPFSSRALPECLRLGAAEFGWTRRSPKPGAVRDGRLLVGMGVASATYPCLRSPASARVRLYPDGRAEVEAAASDMGPGTYTSMTQIAADALQLPLNQVSFRLGRSDFPPTPPHGGSQTLASVGSAIAEACTKARDLLAARPQEIAHAEATAARGAEAQGYSLHAFGAVFVEVVVDPLLGEVRVRRALGVYDVGRVVNPKLAYSQCVGGMIGGMGMALMEQTLLDPRDGRPVNASLADYLVPVNADVGRLDARFVEVADSHLGALGAKGLGEIALVGMAPAIASAVFNATGRRIRDLPIHLEALL